MKRFIAVFGVIVIITMHCLSFYPAKAAITSVDYGEMLNTYLGAAETALAASQGVTIDWSNLDLPSGSENWTDKQKAQYVVQYVGNLKKIGLYAIYDWLWGPDNDTQDIVSAETAAIGLAKNSNIDTLDIKAQLDNILATHSQEHVFQRYSDKVIARWNEYNTNYINDYLSQMNYSNIEEPIPVPDATYFNSYYHTTAPGTIPNWATFDENSYYLFGQSMNNYTFRGTFILVNGGALYVNWDNISGYWTISCDGSPLTTCIDSGKVLYATTYTGSYTGYVIISNNVNNYSLNTWFANNINTQIRSIPNDLASILNYVAKIARNIPVYVNGQLYSALPIDNDLSFSLPDAVIDNSTDDGKIVAHPIYYPDTMNTDKAIDIDLDKVVDAIASRIAVGDTDITFEDLVDAGAAVKLDGTSLTDADTIVQDVSVPIARARVDTIDGVIPTIDVIPPLPPLPPLTPGDYSSEGFSGMSVLARIINATVQGLPEPLILTFFGVVFGAVILGIIKILHH